MSQHLLRLLATAPLSMADLSEACGTAPQTLRRELRALVEEGWVVEVGTDNTTGGRPARIYGLNGGSHILVGVHLEIPTVRLAVVGLDGTVLHRCNLDCGSTAPPLEVMRQIVDQIRELEERHRQRHLVGIGVAAPGFVDPATGGLLSVGRQPQWDSFPISDHLEAEFDVAVTIANDVDCMAHEEFVPGGWEEPDTIYVGFGEGVKASLWLDGRPYHGRLGNAGLIGGTTVAGADGQPVALEQVSSVGAVCEAFASLADAEDPEHAAILGVADRTARFRAIMAASVDRQPLAAEILEAALAALAQGLANVVVLLQPRLLVIGGALAQLDDDRWNALQYEVRTQVHPLIGHQLRLRRARRPSDLGAAFGAAKLALQGVDTSVAAGPQRRRDVRAS